jgi:ABC-type multidrug transport system fused ATPase/permease subunit
VQRSRAEVLAWEKRWSMPAAIAAFAAIGFIVAAIVLAAKGVGHGNGEAELLRNIDAHRTAELISSILQAIGVGLIAFPLYFLFRAADARSEKMRSQLVYVTLVAPLFLMVLAILSGLTTMHAAREFVSDELPRFLHNHVSLTSDRVENAASDAISEAPLRSLAAGFAIAGQLGFVVAMVYTSLYAMRTGLLTRFWGSLGMALGAVSFIFFQFALLWFVYLGLLLIGRVPGGRPPAWASGEPEPWPTPGEKAAAQLEGEEASSPGELPSAEPGAAAEPSTPED